MTAAAADLMPIDLTAIYRLADHLDATLAIGEDLMRVRADIPALNDSDLNTSIAKRQDALTAFARRVRTLELRMVARLVQARARAIEITDVHPRFKPLIRLFVGGTTPLADAAADHGHGLGDISELALASGPDVLAFCKARALLAEDTLSLAGVEALATREDYLLMETIHLGTLLDMVAKFLDALDLAFDLYAEPRAA